MSSIIWRDVWLLLLIIPILAIIGWWWRVVTASRERWLLLLRGLALMSLVFAVAAPSIGVTAEHVALVIVRDRSLSTGIRADQQASIIAQVLATKPTDALVGIVDVAADAQVARVPSADGSDTSLALLTDRNATALADGLTQAAALIPAGYIPRILVLSDGLETSGRVIERIESIRARGVQVDVYPLDSEFVLPIAALRQVSAPQQSQGQGDIIMTVDVASSIAQSAQLIVRNQDGLLVEQTIQLNGTVQQLLVPIANLPTGWHRLEVFLQAAQDDTLPDNRRVLLVQRQGAPRVLLLADPLENATALRDAIAATGSTVTAVRPRDASGRLTDIVSYDVIVLSDTSVTQMPTSLMELIVTAVTVHGRGFLWIGGAESLGAGGFRRSPLSDIAAVSLDPLTPAKQKRLTMYLVIDRSGSMAERDTGLSRLNLAKEAAYQALIELNPTDNVGVVFFDDSAVWALEPQPLPSPEAIAIALGRFAPGGGTSIRAGLQLAHDARNSVEGDIHHVILLSDGIDGNSSDDLAMEIAASGATLSTIALGSQAGVAPLARLAALGGGVDYVVSRPQELPRIFLNETTRVSGRDFVEERVVPQVVTPDALPTGVRDMPAVLGYNRTTLLPDTRVIMQIDAETPLWAMRLVGRGQSAVWASDLGGRWGANWVASDRVRTIIPALLAPLLPQPTNNVAVSWQWYDDILDVDITLREPSETPPDLVVTNASGQTTRLPLDQRTDQRWQARVRDLPSGEYVIQVRDGSEQVVRGVVIDGRSELRNDGQGLAVLNQIATQTGGRVLDVINDALWSTPANMTVRRQDMTPWLVLVAAVLFVSEIGLRRLPFRLPLWRAASTKISAPPDEPPAVPPPLREGPDVPPSRLQRLQNAKRRALD
ncbi:MAG: VWA domain-containing protein [Roseiflexaceae bacterium]